ncbi:DUF3105 domain-containing protein [Actinocrispum wychmicini]|uniref:Uncharacterized protein DUF3105 n=1 Tax=Actinocrispum wychmicini TaxID=1213861 RepID=A0A4R2JI26_9PSEU|nr:DUF3105 domain-containing protein [Actinocrispum wychmicini]TCO56069.1 uncharacterized protein DUF3105 [Actinocrispum wychmicini]
MTETRRWLWRTGLLVAVVGIAALLVVGPYSFSSATITGSKAIQRDSPCLPGTAVSILDSPHISPVRATSVRYDSVPPTSGPHFAATIATGVYPSPVPEGLTVHAMEHGHVVIQYAQNLPGDQIDALNSIARRYGADVVLAPYDKLDSGIALTAWGRIDHLDHYDGSRIATFVEGLRGRYIHGWTHSDDCSPNAAVKITAAPALSCGYSLAAIDGSCGAGSACGCCATCDDRSC